MQVCESPKPFPCNPVPFDPDGPYAMDEVALSDEQYTIWVRSCHAHAPHQLAGWDYLFYKLGVRQPALLVLRGWRYITLFAEPYGLALLQEAQAMVGIGLDKKFDDHLNLIRTYVENLLRDHDEAWDRLEEPENEIWLRKWVPLRPMPENTPVDTNVNTLLRTVTEEWSKLKQSLSPEEAVRRYNRLLSIQTNQLEGLFRLRDNSISRLVRIGFFPRAVQVLQKGSIYYEIPAEAQSAVARVCEDILKECRLTVTPLTSLTFFIKAISIVVSQSEGRVPVDVASINDIHFQSIFHSRFTKVDGSGPTPIYSVVPPGAFRQLVCSTNYNVGDKIGIVQYCNFREVPSQMEQMVRLFNEYLSTLSTSSPIDALRIAAWSHAWFGEIHPFGDGNGRVGRLLSSIPLMRCGLPPINIMGNSNLSTTKKEYVDALVRVQDSDEVIPLIIVILNGMLESLRYIRENCLEENPNDSDYTHRSANGKTMRRIITRVPRRDGHSGPNFGTSARS